MQDRILKYIILEIKLIIRNKKPRENFYQMLAVFSAAALFILYVLHHNISNIGESSNFSIEFLLSIMGGVFIFLHGVFLLTWESTYFEGLNIQNIEMKDYLSAKFYLFILSALAFSIFASLILLFVNVNLISPLLAITSFNAGVGSIFILIYSMFNSERAYLDKSIFLNNEGYGMWQYLYMMLLILTPCLLIKLLDFVFTNEVSLLIIALSGLLTILSCNYWLKMITKIYMKRKYKILMKYSKIL